MLFNYQCGVEIISDKNASNVGPLDWPLGDV